MLESASLLPSQGSLDLNPVAVAILVSEAEENYIGLFSEEFGLLSGVSQSHLFKWVAVRLYLLLDHIRCPHVEIHEGLGLLDLLDDLLMVLESVDLLKEDLGVPADLLWRLRGLHVLGDIRVVISGVQF